MTHSGCPVRRARATLLAALTLIALPFADLAASQSPVGASGAAPPPQSLPLVQADDLVYLGAFNLPTESSGEVKRLDYGGHALGIGPDNTLYIGGHDWYQRLCQVTIPEVGETASFVRICEPVPGGLGSTGGTAKLGGTLLWNGRLIVSKYIYYDGDASAQLSHLVGTPERTAFSAPMKVGTMNPGFYGGYMTLIPQEWRTLLGGPAITGQGLLSIVSRTSYGPAAFVFNPDDLGKNGRVDAKPLVYYPQQHPLADGDTANEFMGFSDMLGGVAFPPGTRSLLFFGRHGTGKPCYGEGAACGDPTDGSKGYHYYPYRAQVWAYDANDLAAVRRGRKDPYDVKPYAIWTMPGLSTTAATMNRGGAVFDPATGKLYVTEFYGEQPKVHVYRLNQPTAK